MFRKLLVACAALALLFSASAMAETVVPGGKVCGTWDESGSPYLIKGEITVPRDQTLTIDPGVVVDVRGHFKMIVHGCLEAVGTERRRILFTAANGAEGWHGIRFINTSGPSRLQWCIIEHGRARGAHINDPEGWGAGVFCSGSSPVLANCIVRDCSTIGAGGGIFCYRSKSELSDCNFTGNHASYVGGGVCIFQSDVAIRQCGVTNNSSEQQGAGIFTQDSYTGIEGCLILGNRCDRWGGGISSLLDHSMTVRDCTITGNTTAKMGGGIAADRTAMTIEDNIISGNRALGSKGGGVYVYNNCSGTVADNIISDNEAQASGGGICLWVSCSVKMINNLVTGNHSSGTGGGIWCSNRCDTVLRNMTIAGNSAMSGGGLYLDNGSEARSINTIFWGNKAIDGAAIWIGKTDQPSTLKISHSDVPPGESAIYVGKGCRYGWGDGMSAGDPLFIDPGNGDFNLCQDPCQPGVKNPCVDTGHPLSPLIPGTTRTDCCCDVGLVDMGYHSPAPNSVVTDIRLHPESGVLPFTTRVTATMRNALGMKRTVAGRIAVTLANGMRYHNLCPGVVDLGPHESHVLSWNQDLPAQERYLGTTIFELLAVDVTPAPFNQSPYPLSGNTDKDTATVTGISP